MEDVVVFVHPLTKADHSKKKLLESELSHLGAQIAKQRRKANLTHVVIARDTSSDLAVDAKEAELEELRRTVSAMEQVRGEVPSGDWVLSP